MALITLNNNSLTNITSLPTGVGGKVLQVVQSLLSTQITTTSDFGSTGNASGLKASITPSSTSNKILIISSVSFNLGGDGSNVNKIGLFGIKHNTSSSLIYKTRGGSTLSSASSDFHGNASMNFLHSPSSTSLQEYEIVFGRYNGTYNNSVTLTSGNEYFGTITLMEITG